MIIIIILPHFMQSLAWQDLPLTNFPHLYFPLFHSPTFEFFFFIYIYIIYQYYFKYNYSKISKKKIVWNFLVYVLQGIERWSLSRVSKFGYLRGHATREKLSFEVSMLIANAIFKNLWEIIQTLWTKFLNFLTIWTLVFKLFDNWQSNHSI